MYILNSIQTVLTLYNNHSDLTHPFPRVTSNLLSENTILFQQPSQNISFKTKRGQQINLSISKGICDSIDGSSRKETFGSYDFQ